MTNLRSSNLKFFPRSMTSQNGVEFGLAQTKAGNRLAVLADSTPAGFDGERAELAGKTLLIGPCNPQNTAALRSRLDWLQPGLLGLRTSAGMGDRIGLATPGHVRAICATGGGLPRSSPSSPSAR
jgi:hypothetical protein